jgi:hypothetical protein
LLLVPAGEETARVLFGVAKIFAQNAGGICEMDNVIAEEMIVLEYVPNESSKKRDVAARADRHPDIGQRAGARKSWIDMDDGRAALLRFHDPAKTNRVRLGHR